MSRGVNHKKYILHAFSCFTACSILFLIATTSGLAVSFISFGIIIYALIGKTLYESYFSIILVSVLVMGNPNLVEKPFLLGIARYLTMIIFSVKAFLYYINNKHNPLFRKKISSFTIPLLIFSIIATICSIVSGWYVQISLLKIAQFFMVTSALFIANANSSVDHSKNASSLLGFFAFFILGSLLVHFIIPASTYVLDEPSGKYLFSGISYQSQTLGLICTFSSLLFLIHFYSFKHLSLVFVILLLIAVCFYLIYKTRSRTALLAAAIPLLFLSLAQLKKGSLRLNFYKRSYFLLLLALVFSPIFYLYSDSISKLVFSFLFKWDTGYYFFADIIHSRMDLIESSWSAFLQRPIFGEGFGVDRSYKFISSAGLFTAPSEKSFILTGILQEVGIIGSLAFIFMLSSFFISASKYSTGLFNFILLFFLFVNLGEYIFFSLGGVGIFGWMFMAIFLDFKKYE